MEHIPRVHVVLSAVLGKEQCGAGRLQILADADKKCQQPFCDSKTMQHVFAKCKR